MLRRSSNLRTLLTTLERFRLAVAICLLLLSGSATAQAADDNGCLLFFYLHDNCPTKGEHADNGRTNCRQDSCKDNDDDQNDKDDNDKDDESKIHYGPCECQPRKTLLQWSYGTTFSGGPPGRDEPLESDRPDFSESPITVGKGVVQVEAGYEYFLDRHAGDVQSEHNFPVALFRIGMFAEWFEWRIEYSYQIINDTISNNPLPPTQSQISGSEDLVLAAKVCLTPQEGILPAMGVIPSLAVPSGSPSITEGAVLPGFIWACGWEINKKIEVEMNTDLFRRRDEVGNDFTEFAQSIAVQFHWTKHFESYIEWYVTSPTGRTIERTEHNADGGFIFPITDNLQLDVEAGLGLNEAARDFFAGAGATVRF